jgi:hypothetical protein
MLVKAGHVIFNTERIIKAEYKKEPPQLYVRLAGGGAKEMSYTSITFKGDDALAIWNVLCGEARNIPGVTYQP